MIRCILAFAAVVFLGGCGTSEPRGPQVNAYDLFPTVSKTDKGYQRVDYSDETVGAEKFPDGIAYFKDGKPCDPFLEIKPGMTKAEVLSVLGEPYIDSDGRMCFRNRSKDIQVSLDGQDRVEKVEKLN